jgi:uncharacterized protein involved in type VI secretion and phage assembly
MSDGVAARIETESFRIALRFLQTELGLDSSKLVTFMSNGVAARIETESFRTALRFLQTELGLDSSKLVTFMSDGVAARIENKSFVNRLRSERVLTQKRVREISQEYRVVRPCVA